MCRMMCKAKDETVSHIISECKVRLDQVAGTVHWSLCKLYELPHTETWYDHRAEKVVENEEAEVLWELNADLYGWINLDSNLNSIRFISLTLNPKEWRSLS